ncbi:MAG TPA: hypothetical protein VFI42_13335 [Thermomicrobiaceae bacterium]|nr:hypothetical protein [Thermomicrobiaceae bacterium]
MIEIVIGEWSLLVDPQATKDRYRTSDSLPSSCRCRYCRNFVAARERVFPDELLAVLEQLGVDRSREAETQEVAEVGPGWHHYIGHFPFVGEVLEGVDPWKPIPMGERAAIWFNGASVPMTASMRDSFADQPTMLVRFAVTVPWVLSAPPSRKPAGHGGQN